MGNYYAFNRAILQESPQKYGPEQLAILQKMLNEIRRLNARAAMRLWNCAPVSTSWYTVVRAAVFC
ncbi:MAG: hypothetical protein WBX81_01565 [Nitrososphaeraceae archaeon]